MNRKDLHEEIDEILAELHQPTASTHTTEEQPHQGPTRLIDIHIYDLPAQDPPSVESTLEQQSEQDASEPATQSTPQRARPPKRRARSGRRLLVLVLCLTLLIAAALVVVLVVPLLTASASVTIIPVSTTINTSSTLTIVTGPTTKPDQLQGRSLAAVSMTQARTAPTTGKAHQDAKTAHGLVTLYNAATVAQTVPAGTLLTGADGVEIVIDVDAIIPAGTLATNGQVSILAHALETGPAGNIKAGDIYGPCCRANMLAANAAFTGGQDARDYQTVTTQDISTITTSLKTRLDQSVQAALQTEVQSDETLVTPLACQQSITPDHQPGEEATTIHILMQETCSGMTYRTQDEQQRLAQLAEQQARSQLGDGYHLVHDLQQTISQVTPTAQGWMVHIQFAGTWVYQFTQEQQQHMKTLIAGKHKTQAINALLQVPGVQSVSIGGTQDNTTLPTDPGRLHFTFLVMA